MLVTSEIALTSMSYLCADTKIQPHSFFMPTKFLMVYLYVEFHREFSEM